MYYLESKIAFMGMCEHMHNIPALGTSSLGLGMTATVSTTTNLIGSFSMIQIYFVLHYPVSKWHTAEAFSRSVMFDYSSQAKMVHASIFRPHR